MVRKQPLFLISLLILFSNLSFGQEQDNLPLKKLNQDRYQNVLGSPYLYADWVPAEIIGMDGNIYKEATINFNGETHEMDVKRGDQIKELIAGSYLKVTVNLPDHNESFLRGLHPRFNMNQVCLLYDSQRLKFIKNFTVKKEEFAEPNAISEKFITRTEYFIMEDGNLAYIALRKKKILGALRHGKELESYVKKNELSLKKEAEVIEFLQYYRSIYLH